MPRVAILTYHPIRILGNTYGENDLVALASDLEQIGGRGIRLRSLTDVITQPHERHLFASLDEPTICITLDDGSVFDYRDRVHPSFGPQRSAASILMAAVEASPRLAASRPLASTFVIASPAAREELDRVDYFGGGYWTDDWWQAAAAGPLSVESHSWDHNHPSLARSAQRNNERGTFRNIDTWADAEAEIAESLRYIGMKVGVPPRFLAFPWGESSAYLREQYLPTRGVSLGLRAAFGTGNGLREFASEASPRWNIPRMVCGVDWRSPQEFSDLLDGLMHPATQSAPPCCA